MAKMGGLKLELPFGQGRLKITKSAGRLTTQPDPKVARGPVVVYHSDSVPEATG